MKSVSEIERIGIKHFINIRLQSWHVDCCSFPAHTPPRKKQMNILPVSHLHNIRFDIAVAVLAAGMVLGVVSKFLA